MIERHLTTKQVSEVTAIAAGTLAQWRCREQKPNARPLGPKWKRLGRAVRYAEADVRAWLAEREVHAAK